MENQQEFEALGALIKALKGDDSKALAKALALQGTCPRCKSSFQWGKGLDIVARTVSCPHCGSELVSF
jgi:hypothetical protein